MREARQRLAVGFFDGVHLGHRAILRGASAALTFRNHPLTVLAPDRAPPLLMSEADRLATLRALGLEVTALDFDAALAALPPEDFLKLMKRLVAPAGLSVRCGANWRFGRDGEGDAEWLSARGIPVTVVPYAEYLGEPVSSTRIRATLLRGELEHANAMLGRAYTVRGEVVKGKGLGTALGYPTVNIVPELSGADGDRLPLPLGVYAAELGGMRAIANYGLAPTAGERAWPAPVLEVHLLPDAGASGSSGLPSAGLPGSGASSVSLALRRFIRPERRFESLAALRAQIAEDIRSCGI